MSNGTLFGQRYRLPLLLDLDGITSAIHLELRIETGELGLERGELAKRRLAVFLSRGVRKDSE